MVISLYFIFIQILKLKSSRSSPGPLSPLCFKISSTLASLMPNGKSFHFLYILRGWSFPGNSRIKLQILIHIHSTPLIRAVTPQSAPQFLQKIFLFISMSSIFFGLGWFLMSTFEMKEASGFINFTILCLFCFLILCVCACLLLGTKNKKQQLTRNLHRSPDMFGSRRRAFFEKIFQRKWGPKN